MTHRVELNITCQHCHIRSIAQSTLVRRVFTEDLGDGKVQEWAVHQGMADFFDFDTHVDPDTAIVTLSELTKEEKEERLAVWKDKI